MNYENGFICHITIISYASIKFDDYILGLKVYREFLYTLPRKILLCPINWGTQWTMEISSNE